MGPARIPSPSLMSGASTPPPEQESRAQLGGDPVEAGRVMALQELCPVLWVHTQRCAGPCHQGGPLAGSYSHARFMCATPCGGSVGWAPACGGELSGMYIVPAHGMPVVVPSNLGELPCVSGRTPEGSGHVSARGTPMPRSESEKPWVFRTQTLAQPPGAPS